MDESYTLMDIKTLQEISKEYNVPVVTLRKRLDYKSFNMIENIDYRKFGERMPILVAPCGVKKILKK